MIVSNICVVSLFRKKMTAQQALYHIFSYCFLLWKSRLLSLRWQALLPQAQQTISISFFSLLNAPCIYYKAPSFIIQTPFPSIHKEASPGKSHIKTNVLLPRNAFALLCTEPFVPYFIRSCNSLSKATLSPLCVSKTMVASFSAV